jgi:phenylacetate-CoA ligase
MNLNKLPNKFINNIKYRMLRHRKKKHSELVSNYIDKLSDYHLKGFEFDFSTIRKQLLKDILKYAYSNTVYYKEILHGKSIAAIIDASYFKRIPFLTKDIIRTRSKDLISDIVPAKSLSPRKTGGSTGEPLAFWSSGSTDDIHQKFLLEQYNYIAGDKILALDGTLIENDLTQKGIYWKPKNNGGMLPYGGMALSSLYLTKENIQVYLNFILSYKPEFIRGYPAFITEIAQYIVSNNIHVNFKMKGIELTSEICLNSQVSIIKKAFQTNVFGQYGHTEASVFGYTIDDTFSYYCSPLYGFTEVIGDKDQQVGIGEEGEIVVTGFSNFGMPFIRYRTGDRAIYGGEKNGIIKLDQVLGRTADYIFNNNYDKTSLTALVFGQHYNAFKNIAQWQIIQDKGGEITVSIQKLSGYSQADEDEIALTFQNIAQIKCNFVYDQELIKTRSGKVKFVIQNINR